mgnify:CR=1 FL=1
MGKSKKRPEIVSVMFTNLQGAAGNEADVSGKLGRHGQTDRTVAAQSS